MRSDVALYTTCYAEWIISKRWNVMRHELCRWSSFGRNFSVWMLPFRCPLKNVLILRKRYTTVSSAVAVLSVYCVFTVGCSANLWPAAQSRPGFYPAQSSSQGGAGRQRDGCQLCSYVRHDTSRHYVIMHSGPAIRHSSGGRLETKVTCVRPAALAS